MKTQHALDQGVIDELRQANLKLAVGSISRRYVLRTWRTTHF